MAGREIVEKPRLLKTCMQEILQRHGVGEVDI
jgi:hypothetical protein